jgi:hypothetical protein
MGCGDPKLFRKRLAFLVSKQFGDAASLQSIALHTETKNLFDFSTINELDIGFFSFPYLFAHNKIEGVHENPLLMQHQEQFSFILYFYVHFLLIFQSVTRKSNKVLGNQ